MDNNIKETFKTYRDALFESIQKDKVFNTGDLFRIIIFIIDYLTNDVVVEFDNDDNEENNSIEEKLKKLNSTKEVQKTDLSSEYMIGLYNGLELASSIFENRNPEYMNKYNETYQETLEKYNDSVVEETDKIIEKKTIVTVGVDLKDCKGWKRILKLLKKISENDGIPEEFKSEIAKELEIIFTEEGNEKERN